MFGFPLSVIKGSTYNNMLLHILSARGRCRAHYTKNQTEKGDGSQEAASSDSRIKEKKGQISTSIRPPFG